MTEQNLQTQGIAGEIVVLTGDLVNSSKLDPNQVREALHVLDTASRDIASVWGTSVPRDRAAPSSDHPARFSAFRGDSWQCLGPRPSLSLRAVLILRARLRTLGRAFDTRISIGIGKADLPDLPDLNTASGPAFELSGRNLDKMERARRFAIAWQTPPLEAPLVQAVFALADEISRNWTPHQARTFGLRLGDRRLPTQESLAQTLDITQQSVAKQLSGGGDWALLQALTAMEGAA